LPFPPTTSEVQFDEKWAFVRLEYHRFTTGVSWFEAKWSLVRDAVRGYLSNPRYRLPPRATA